MFEKRVRIYSGVFAVLCLLCMAVGEGASEIWWADLLSHFLPYWLMAFGIFAGIFLALSHRLGFLVFILGFGALQGGAWFHSKWNSAPSSPSLQPSSEKSFKLIAFNVLTENKEKQKVLDWITSQIDPNQQNIIYLMEVDESWSEAFRSRSQQWPYFKEIPRDDNFGMAVYSNRPLENVEVKTFDRAEVPALFVTVQASSRSIRFLGLHPLPPVSQDYAAARNQAFGNIQNFLKGLDGPMIVAGDFNSTPWSAHFRQNFGNFQSAFQGLFRQHTWSQGLVSIPIDHVLFTEPLTVSRAEVGPHLGSDHRPLIVEFFILP